MSEVNNVFDITHIPTNIVPPSMRLCLGRYAKAFDIKELQSIRGISLGEYPIDKIKELNVKMLKYMREHYENNDYINEKSFQQRRDFVFEINKMIDKYKWDKILGCSDWEQYLEYNIPIGYYMKFHNKGSYTYRALDKFGIPYHCKGVYRYGYNNSANAANNTTIIKLKDLLTLIEKSKAQNKKLFNAIMRFIPKIVRELKDERLQLFRIAGKGAVSKERNRWYDIKRRCYNTQHKDYKWYGAKGIKMCDEWLNDKYAFVEWVLKQDLPKDWTIDRKDADGDYCPENCIMIPRHQNCVIKFQNGIDKKAQGDLPKFRYYRDYGGLYQFQYFNAILGIGKENYKRRIKNGYTLFEALNIGANGLKKQYCGYNVRNIFWIDLKQKLQNNPSYEFEIFLDTFDTRAYYIKQNEVKKCPKCHKKSVRIEINPKCRLVCDKCGFDFRLESDYKIPKGIQRKRNIV